MKRLGIYVISSLFLFQSYVFAYSSNPEKFISELVGEVIIKLSYKNLNKDEKTDFIEKVAL